MVNIYFELGGDHSLKKAFVSLLPKMLIGYMITIVEEKLKSIIVPQIGYFKHANFQSLDSIYTRTFILK